MEIYTFGSGSKGNCTLIKTKNTNLIIDAGIGYRKIQSIYEDIDKEDIDGILLTHSHSDHVSGIGQLLNRKKCPIYLSYGTNKGFHTSVVQATFGVDKRYVSEYESFRINDIHVTPIPASHDAKETLGYIFETENVKVVYITDTGVVYLNAEKYMVGADAYLIESNYDPIMLSETNRPHFLKKRIQSNVGHLSNLECAVTLSKVINENTKHVMLMHLSREANNKKTALKTNMDFLLKEGVNMDSIDIVCADQYELTHISLNGDSNVD